MEYKYLLIEELGDDFEIFEGDTKTIRYKITNTGRYIVRDIQIQPVIINADTGEPVTNNYIKSTSEVPDFLLPDGGCDFSVELEIPPSYEEMSTVNDVENLAPLDVHLQVRFRVYVTRNSDLK